MQVNPEKKAKLKKYIKDNKITENELKDSNTLLVRYTCTRIISFVSILCIFVSRQNVNLVILIIIPALVLNDEDTFTASPLELKFWSILLDYFFFNFVLERFFIYDKIFLQYNL